MLSQQQAEVPQAYFQQEWYPKGALIQHPPGICRKAYFIEQGYVRQAYYQDGKELTAYVYKQQGFFTDLRSFLTQQPSRYHFYAMTDCTLCWISKEALEALFASDPGYEKWGRVVYQQIALEVIEAAERLLFLTPEERYQQLLAQQQELFRLLPRKHIATLLGVTAES